MATILVIDDEKMICDLLHSVFFCHGHEVITATNGRKGLDLFRQRKPRFTLLDLHMPGMDGIEVLKQIRAIDPQAGVIMLTGRGTDVLEIQARELGVTDFLSKGLSLEVLVKALEKAMSRSAQTTGARSAATPAGGQGSESILVVDDEPQITTMVGKFLAGRGYRVRTAPDGPTALAMVEQEIPHFIITDMSMPGMNGLELLRALRAKHYEGAVLALTASQDEHLLQGMLDLGAVDVMGKPVNLETLELAVQLGCILTAA